MKEVFINVMHTIVAEFDLVSFLAALAYGLAGMLVKMLVNANNRDVTAPNSPTDFSWYHLIKDNAIRVITNIVLLCVFIRFSQELLGKTVTSWLGFCLGLISDILGKLLQRALGGLQDKISGYIDTVFGKEKDTGI